MRSLAHLALALALDTTCVVLALAGLVLRSEYAYTRLFRGCLRQRRGETVRAAEVRMGETRITRQTPC
ncbi:MAG: hypothetical protein V3V67_08570 [Myxococcota bacterium]